jgi:hypothetical protein
MMDDEESNLKNSPIRCKITDFLKDNRVRWNIRVFERSKTFQRINIHPRSEIWRSEVLKSFLWVKSTTSMNVSWNLNSTIEITWKIRDHI